MWIDKELYNKIKQVMPIPCVDLIVENNRGEILLLKRKNEPAKGQWWFPGGRVHLGETRKDAVKRKLKEECGLEQESLKEVGTYDIILEFSDNLLSHGITTVFKIVINNPIIKLDKQSSFYEWHYPHDWLTEEHNEFVSKIIKQKIRDDS